MEQQIFTDFLLKQLPVIVVESLFCYFMYKYFTKVIEDKEKKITQKDEEIKELNTKVANLFMKTNETISNNNGILTDLRGLILQMLTK